jgi:hypothetical protein
MISVNNERLALCEVRNRDFVLRAFLPCALWLLKRKGRDEFGYPDLCVRLPGDVVLCWSRMDEYRGAISIYAFVKGVEKKVFSAHLTNRPDYVDAGFYRNGEGHVGIMSWRRGEWEDIIVAECFQDDVKGFWKAVLEKAGGSIH